MCAGGWGIGRAGHIKPLNYSCGMRDAQLRCVSAPRALPSTREILRTLINTCNLALLSPQQELSGHLAQDPSLSLLLCGLALYLLAASTGASTGTSIRKGNTTNDMLRFTLEKNPLPCSQCTATFSRRDTLRRHLRSLHPDAQDPSPTLDNVVLSVRHDRATPAQACTRHPPSNAGPLDYDARLDCPPTSTSPDALLQFAFESFDWQWDSALNLDSSFSMGDLGTCEPDSFGHVGRVLDCWPPPPNLGFLQDNYLKRKSLMLAICH
jgi:hypothetical protein